MLFNWGNAQAKKQALLDEVAAQEEATEEGSHCSHVRAAQSAALPPANAHGYNSTLPAFNSQGAWVGATSRPRRHQHQICMSWHSRAMLGSQWYPICLRNQACHWRLPLSHNSGLRHQMLEWCLSNIVSNLMLFLNTPASYKQGVKADMAGAAYIHALAGRMTGVSPDGHSSNFVVPASKVLHPAFSHMRRDAARPVSLAIYMPHCACDVGCKLSCDMSGKMLQPINVLSKQGALASMSFVVEFLCLSRLVIWFDWCVTTAS